MTKMILQLYTNKPVAKSLRSPSLGYTRGTRIAAVPRCGNQCNIFVKGYGNEEICYTST